MTVEGWGISPWGGSSWGGGSIAHAIRAYPVTRRVVRVHFTGQLRARSAIGAGDALNPDVWVVTELDPLGAVVRTLTTATVIASTPNYVMDVWTIEPLGLYTAAHHIAFPQLRAASSVLVPSPRVLAFQGVGLASSANRELQHDLRNNVLSSSIYGAFQVGADGDYEGQRGVEFFRKLVIRRVTTTPGAFAHLGDSYGVGIKLKEPVRNLAVLRTAIERQVSEEPELKDVHATLSLASNGILTITITAVIRATDSPLVVEVEAEPE